MRRVRTPPGQSKHSVITTAEPPPNYRQLGGQAKREDARRLLNAQGIMARIRHYSHPQQLSWCVFT